MSEPLPERDSQPGEISIPITRFLLPCLVILLGIGWLVSPRNAAGHPILLTPGIKAVEDYRRQSLVWSNALRLVDGDIAKILAEPTSADLLGRSQQAQGLFEQALRIAQEIDQQSAPPTLLGLQEQLSKTSMSYLDSVQLTLRWVSSPTVEHASAARAKLADAQARLVELEKSQWLTAPSP